ncbi:plasmid pRiA4b ORF-3 family protein [Cupriavidus sp. PET2-C1]
MSVLQLRIALSGLSPPVWRRVLVPEHLTLGQLHNVIQVVMGWADEHPHTFSIRGRRYGEAHEGVLQFSAAANELPLTALRLREHEGFVYVSDFNAWWRHEIRVERRRLRQHPGGLPRCAAGCGPCRFAKWPSSGPPQSSLKTASSRAPTHIGGCTSY